MTVSTSYAPLSFNGDDATTAFAVTWPFFDSSLVVTLVDSTGVETVKTITTHYTVSGGTDSDGLPATGTVTMLTAPASGETLRITRNTSKVQSSSWTNGGAYQAKTLEATLDKIILIAQETQAGINDDITGDVMQLNTSGATDYWDAEDNVIRNVSNGSADDDAVTVAQLNAAVLGDYDIGVREVATLAELKSLVTSVSTVAALKASGREGLFVWTTGDYSAECTADTEEGIYVVSDGTASTSGAWIRADSDVINPKWFGADPTGTADSTAAFQGAAAMYTLLNREFYCPDGLYLIAEQIAFELPTRLNSNYEPPPKLIFGSNARLQASATIAGALVRWGSDGGGVSYSGLIRNGYAEGGVFDCNDNADVGFYVPFCNNVLLFAMQARNFNQYGFQCGSSTAPQTSYGALLDQCQTERYGAALNITGITQANPGVVTVSSAHGFTTGDKITLTSVSGMTEVNDTIFTITVVDATSFSIGVNTSGYTAYTSGGIAYSGYAPTGSVGIYYDSCGDSHATNCTLTGIQIGISHNAAGYDGKYVSNHVWNFLFNGEVLYGFNLAGDNQLIGNQVDGPFQYAYRFTALRNQLFGCQVTYTDGTYGGVDNYAYPVRIETGGGATAIGCDWKAASNSYRLAGEVSGDISNFISYGNRAVYMVTEPDGEYARSDIDTTYRFTRRNSSTHASAKVVQDLVTDAGILELQATSTAGGASALVDWSGANPLYLSAGNSGASVEIQTDYTTRLKVDATTGRVSAVSATGGLGYGTGAGGTVTQTTSKATSVTINKVCGQITMHNATLNAGALVGFSVANSAVAADDTVIVNISGGATWDSYQVSVDDVSAGFFRVVLLNASASNLSEAVILNFSVIKAVTA